MLRRCVTNGRDQGIEAWRCSYIYLHSLIFISQVADQRNLPSPVSTQDLALPPVSTWSQRICCSRVIAGLQVSVTANKTTAGDMGCLIGEVQNHNAGRLTMLSLSPPLHQYHDCASWLRLYCCSEKSQGQLRSVSMPYEVGNEGNYSKHS